MFKFFVQERCPSSRYLLGKTKGKITWNFDKSPDFLLALALNFFWL